MDAAEVEFLSENEEITVVPNFTLDTVYLISGDIGPFSAGLPVNVPLWLAINMKQQSKCRIQPPAWMSVDFLQERLKAESESPFFCEPIHNSYKQIAHSLLNCSPDTISNADEVRTLIKDIWDLRMAKLRSSIDKFVNQQETYAGLDNLTLMEINTVRPFLTPALDHMYKLRISAIAAERSA